AAEARDQLAAAAADGLRLLRDGANEVLDQIRGAQEDLREQLAEGRRAAAQELDALQQQVAAAERREESGRERLDGHVSALVERTDATVATSLSRLQAVAEALLERDARQEKERVDEFARVLETVLREGGSSTRRLRDRIFRGMENAKAQPPVSAPA